MISIDEFQNLLLLRPCSVAIEKILNAFPHSGKFLNSSQRLLFYANAWTACVRSRGIALTIDDGISEDYSALLKSLAEVGAVNSFEYATKAADVCGGKIPSDEIERAKLAMEHDEELYELDKLYNESVREEAAEALLKRFSEDIGKAFEELARRGRQ